MSETDAVSLTDYITHPESRVPSNFVHPTHRIVNEDGQGYGNTTIESVADTANPHQQAGLVSSEIVNSGHSSDPKDLMHTVMVDLDLPAALVPSSTPGHSHLYIDLPITWKQYRKILEALHDAGIIETGYYDSAVRHHRSYLRMPGVQRVVPRGPAISDGAA